MKAIGPEGQEMQFRFYKPISIGFAVFAWQALMGHNPQVYLEGAQIPEGTRRLRVHGFAGQPHDIFLDHTTHATLAWQPRRK